jgi:hypothetical protein
MRLPATRVRSFDPIEDIEVHSGCYWHWSSDKQEMHDVRHFVPMAVIGSHYQTLI